MKVTLGRIETEFGEKLRYQDPSNQPKFREAVPREIIHLSKCSKDKHTLFDKVLDIIFMF